MLRNFKNSISLQEHRLFISPNNTIVIWRLNKNKKKMLKDLFIKKSFNITTGYSKSSV